MSMYAGVYYLYRYKTLTALEIYTLHLYSYGFICFQWVPKTVVAFKYTYKDTHAYILYVYVYTYIDTHNCG